MGSLHEDIAAGIELAARRRWRRLLLVAGLLGVLAVGAVGLGVIAAQSRARAAPPPAPSISVTTAPAIVLPPRRAYQHPYKIETSYDKFEDFSASTLTMPVNRTFDLDLLSGFRGTRRIDQAGSVLLNITNREDRHDQFDRVVFIIDGERCPLEIAPGAAGFRAPVSLLLKCANARGIVEARADHGEPFHLMDEHREALKDFLSRLGP